MNPVTELPHMICYFKDLAPLQEITSGGSWHFSDDYTIHLPSDPGKPSLVFRNQNTLPVLGISAPYNFYDLLSDLEQQNIQFSSRFFDRARRRSDRFVIDELMAACLQQSSPLKYAEPAQELASFFQGEPAYKVFFSLQRGAGIEDARHLLRFGERMHTQNRGVAITVFEPEEIIEGLKPDVCPKPTLSVYTCVMP